MRPILVISTVVLILCGCDLAPVSNSVADPAQEATAESPREKAVEGTLIPRSMPGDKGRYYLLTSSKAGDVVTAIHKRIGLDSVGYTKTETNCATMRMREMGYSKESAEAISNQPTDWFELVPGASKADLADFVCRS